MSKIHGIVVREKKSKKLMQFISCSPVDEITQIEAQIDLKYRTSRYSILCEVIDEVEYQQFLNEGGENE